jgi:hypothetical protein
MISMYLLFTDDSCGFHLPGLMSYMAAGDDVAHADDSESYIEQCHLMRQIGIFRDELQAQLMTLGSQLGA